MSAVWYIVLGLLGLVVLILAFVFWRKFKRRMLIDKIANIVSREKGGAAPRPAPSKSSPKKSSSKKKKIDKENKKQQKYIEQQKREDETDDEVLSDLKQLMAGGIK